MSRAVRRVVLFVGGLLSILVGLVLIVLPGPLTIPPILFGLWLWSLEFEFAQRWLHPVKKQGAAAWEAAQERPIRTTTFTVLGLVAAGVVIWAALRFDALEHGRRLVGL
jgi:uncharacterized membrane protein YbaN (DUF454 family)